MQKLTRLIELEKIPSGTSQQRKIAYVNGRVMSYPSKSLEEARKIYAYALRMAKKPSEPLSGAIKLSLVFLYGTKDKRKIKGIWKTTKGDVDNIAKVFIDSLVREGWLVDDANIVCLSVQKKWYESSKILFELEEVG